MTSDTRHVTGRFVRERRQALGLSQRELADAIGLSVGMVRDLEQGRTSRPHPESLGRLSAVLGIDLRAAAIPGADSAGAKGVAETSPYQPALPNTARFLILGVLEVWRGNTAIVLGNGKPRTLIAYLALNAGTAIHRDTLIELLWQDRPPGKADKLLGEYVRSARERLSAGYCITVARQGSKQPEIIERVGRGFRMNRDLLSRDVDDFVAYAQRGRDALNSGRHEKAVELTNAALRLWRGEVLCDFEALKNLPEMVDLGRQRMRTVLDLADAYTGLGYHGEALSYLETAAVREPFDESIQAKLLLTLARSGRQTEALTRYQDFCQLLDDELGLRPGRQLAETQTRILRGELGCEPGSEPRLATAVIRRQLPPDSSLFTGRAGEVADLIQEADRALADQGTPAARMLAIEGMAGVGKTALAVRAAHLLADRFPGGQLFVDLHGYSPDLLPRDPKEVLGELLQILEVPPPLIPTDTAARAALYRGRLAGTRTLIVLDNAATAKQIRPLLPGSGDCLVMVTSRRRLVSLEDAYRLTLGKLPKEDSYQLLMRTADATASTEESEGLRELARLCGGLPLALRIIGALIRHRPGFAPSVMAERLRSGLSSNDPLSAFDDGDRNLPSIFELSYRSLHRKHRDMFRALGSIPGPDIDTFAAAALADVNVATAQRLLSELTDHNLLIESEPGRFRFHDLLRLDALTRAAQEDGESCTAAAIRRLLDYYDFTARQVDQLISQRHGQATQHVFGGEVPRIENRIQAMNWMRAEIRNLIAVTRHAATSGDRSRLISMTNSMHRFLYTQGPWPEALELHTAAVAASRAIGDPELIAGALARLGVIKRLTGDIPVAVTILEDARGQMPTESQAHDRAAILGELGETYRVRGDNQRAKETLTHALAEYAEARDSFGRAGALTSLGIIMLGSSTGPLKAGPFFREALQVYSGLGDHTGIFTVLSHIGELHRIQGDYAEADRVLAAALEHARISDNHIARANLLLRFGYLQYLMDDPNSSMRALTEAQDIFLELGSKPGEANALMYIGAVQTETADYKHAVETLGKAREIYRIIDSERGQMIASSYEAASKYMLGEEEGARRVLTRAIKVFHESGDGVNEAFALNLMGSFARAAGASDQAIQAHRRALMLARRSERRAIELDALRGLGTAYASQGESSKAIEYLKSALELCRKLGVHKMESVKAELISITCECQ